MNKQKINIIIISVIGMLATFMPWVNISNIETVKGSSGDGWITFALFSVPLIIFLLKDATKNQRFIASISSILAAALGVWKIFSFYTTIANDPLVSVFNIDMSIGFGIYVVIIAGISIPTIIFMNRKEL